MSDSGSNDEWTTPITALGITGATAADNGYDAATDAEVFSRSLVGAARGTRTAGGDHSTIDTEDVGTGRIVTRDGATLTGADAGTMSSAAWPGPTASIDDPGLAASFAAASEGPRRD
ncbi:MAG TPA: hypothetical protein VK894_04670 [Jiangellales bacterium]|nr:hypothetical protein [Jiangellales bacterium]